MCTNNSAHKSHTKEMPSKATTERFFRMWNDRRSDERTLEKFNCIAAKLMVLFHIVSDDRILVTSIVSLFGKNHRRICSIVIIKKKFTQQTRRTTTQLLRNRPITIQHSACNVRSVDSQIEIGVNFMNGEN